MGMRSAMPLNSLEIPLKDLRTTSTEICKSIDCLVNAAIAAVQEDRVNSFDHMRINSSVPG